jgi:hypothetical protein
MILVYLELVIYDHSTSASARLICWRSHLTSNIMNLLALRDLHKRHSTFFAKRALTLSRSLI